MPGGSGSYSHSSSQMSRIASNPRPNSRAHGVSYNCSAPVVLQPAPASSFNEALYTAGQCVGGEEYDVLDQSAVSAHFAKHVSRLIVAANKDASVPASPLFRHVAAAVSSSRPRTSTRGALSRRSLPATSSCRPSSQATCLRTTFATLSPTLPLLRRQLSSGTL